LDNSNPSKVDNKKVGYVTRGSNKRNTSSVRFKFRKRKVVIKGEIQKMLMFKLQKKLVRNYDVPTSPSILWVCIVLYLEYKI
jgi:hypothetical protein